MYCPAQIFHFLGAALAALPSYVLAAAALYGAVIAHRGLDTWREQNREARQTDFAQRLFSAWTKMRRYFLDAEGAGEYVKGIYSATKPGMREDIHKEVISVNLGASVENLRASSEEFGRLLMEARMLHKADSDAEMHKLQMNAMLSAEKCATLSLQITVKVKSPTATDENLSPIDFSPFLDIDKRIGFVARADKVIEEYIERNFAHLGVEQQDGGDAQ